MKLKSELCGIFRVGFAGGVFSLSAAACTLEQAGDTDDVGSLSEAVVSACATTTADYVGPAPTTCAHPGERVMTPNANYDDPLCPKQFIAEFTGANNAMLWTNQQMVGGVPTTQQDCETWIMEMEVYQYIDPPGSPPPYWFKHPTTARHWGVWANGKCQEKWSNTGSGIYANDENPYLGKFRLVGRATVNRQNRMFWFVVSNHNCP